MHACTATSARARPHDLPRPNHRHHGGSLFPFRRRQGIGAVPSGPTHGCPRVLVAWVLGEPRDGQARDPSAKSNDATISSCGGAGGDGATADEGAFLFLFFCKNLVPQLLTSPRLHNLRAGSSGAKRAGSWPSPVHENVVDMRRGALLLRLVGLLLRRRLDVRHPASAKNPSRLLSPRDHTSADVVRRRWRTVRLTTAMR